MTKRYGARPPALDRVERAHRALAGSYIALNSLARFALNDVFLIKIPSKGKKTIVSCMIKDVHVSIFLSINVKMRDESVRTCWPSSRPMPPSRTHPLVPRFTRSHA